MKLAARLKRANVQFEVLSEDGFTAARAGAARVTLLESRDVASEPAKQTLQSIEQAGKPVVTADSPEWFESLQKAIGSPSLTMDGPATVRGVVRDTKTSTVVHVYNLNVERLSSFEDKVTPAENLRVSVFVPFAQVKAVHFSSADPETPSREIEFTATEEDSGSRVEVTIPKVVVSAMIVVE